MKKHLLSLAVAGLLANLASAQYSLTLLHNNDGESQISNIASFSTMLSQTRSFYEGQGHGVLSLYAGDSFLAGPEFQASLDTNTDPLLRTYYDARALSQMGYNAAIFGNHEFDRGPDTLAGFIAEAQTTNPLPYLSANLDFSGETNLQNLVGTSILPSTFFDVNTSAGTKRIGVIGATTTSLPFISSPRNVVVNNVAASIDAQVTALLGQGVDHIVVASHLQGISTDQALVTELTNNFPTAAANIDLIIAGGGDEFLVNQSALSPTTVYGASAPVSVIDTGFNAADVEGDYPVAGGIPIVTSSGDYDFLGRVTLNFNSDGSLAGIDSTSNPQENTGYADDPTVAATVAPVNTFTANLNATPVVNSSAPLIGNGNRNVIRAEEAPLGNLVADAMLDKAAEEAANNGVGAPDIAIMNGGGIRADVVDGAISRLDTFSVLPFGNTMGMVEGVTSEDFLQVLEVAVSKVGDSNPDPAIIEADQAGSDTGRFLHFAGGKLVYDIHATPMELDANGNILVQGERVISFILDDGTEIVLNGEAVNGETLNIVGLNFTLGGGDQILDPDYMSQAYGVTLLSDNAGLIGDQAMFEEYLNELSGGNTSFDISSIAEHAGPVGRIVAVPEPASAGALVALFSGLLLTLRRRRA